MDGFTKRSIFQNASGTLVITAPSRICRYYSTVVTPENGLALGFLCSSFINLCRVPRYRCTPSLPTGDGCRDNGDSGDDESHLFEAVLPRGIYAGFRLLLFGQSSACSFSPCQCLLLPQLLALRFFFLVLRVLASGGAGSEELAFESRQHVGVSLIELSREVEAAAFQEVARIASVLRVGPFVGGIAKAVVQPFVVAVLGEPTFQRVPALN